MPFKGDPTAAIGTAGFVATLSLAEINNVVSILVGVATLGFVVTRWLSFVHTRGGLRTVFLGRDNKRPPQS